VKRLNECVLAARDSRRGTIVSRPSRPRSKSVDAGLFRECGTDRFDTDAMGVTAPLVFSAVSVFMHRGGALFTSRSSNKPLQFIPPIATQEDSAKV
jgi:hypothetical protein